MLHLDILQNQWVILAVFGGLAGTLVLVLAYLAFWRAAEPAAAPLSRVPWVLIVLYAVMAVYAVVYVLMQAACPQTW
jgi:hypothetical protein